MRETDHRLSLSSRAIDFVVESGKPSAHLIGKTRQSLSQEPRIVPCRFDANLEVTPSLTVQFLGMGARFLIQLLGVSARFRFNFSA